MGSELNEPRLHLDGEIEKPASHVLLWQRTQRTPRVIRLADSRLPRPLARESRRWRTHVSPRPGLTRTPVERAGYLCSVAALCDAFAGSRNQNFGREGERPGILAMGERRLFGLAVELGEKSFEAVSERVVVITGDHVAGGLDVDGLSLGNELEHVGHASVADDV